MRKKVNPKVINMIEGYVPPGHLECIAHDYPLSVVTREEGLKKMLSQVQKDKKSSEED